MKDQTQPVKDFTYIKDWCQTISTKFTTLEKGIDRWKLRAATSSRDEDKSWINLNLQVNQQFHIAVVLIKLSLTLCSIILFTEYSRRS